MCTLTQNRIDWFILEKFSQSKIFQSSVGCKIINFSMFLRKVILFFTICFCMFRIWIHPIQKTNSSKWTIPFRPSLTLSCSKSSDGMSWASSIPDWHWLIDISLYWSLWKQIAQQKRFSDPLCMNNRCVRECCTDLTFQSYNVPHETMIIFSWL